MFVVLFDGTCTTLGGFEKVVHAWTVGRCIMYIMYSGIRAKGPKHMD